MEKWRLLDIETPNDAAMNLAIDEAVFIEKMKKDFPPALRFWRNRRAVVIGYSQNVEAEVNLAICREKSIQIVRRFSGGGAVYQDLGNLNYSITLEADHSLLKGLDIAESYRVFSSGVIEGLKQFGIDSVFDSPSDLLVRNKKVSGNAQSRKKGVILHHGTLLVNVEFDSLTRVLNAPKEQLKNRKVTSRRRPVVNLEDEIGYHVDIEKVKEVLQRGFEKAFSVKLVPSALTLEEKETAQILYVSKYSQRKWNFWR